MSLGRGSGSFRRTLAPNADFADQLVDAVRNGDGGRLADLINQGGSDVNLNAKDRTGATLLKWAAYSGQWQSVEILLKHGANMNVKDNSGNTPLITCCAYGFPEVVLLLLEKGADMEAKSRNGNTALIMASAYGHTDALSLLIEHGAEIDAINKAGNSALHVAGKNGQFESAEMLLKHGANLNVKNTNGQTPFDLAYANNFVDLMEILREKRELAFNVRRSRYSRAAMREALAVFDYDGPVGGITDQHVAEFLDGVATRIAKAVSPTDLFGCNTACGKDTKTGQKLLDREEEWRMLPPKEPQPSVERKQAQEDAVQRAISSIMSPRADDAAAGGHSVVPPE